MNTIALKRQPIIFILFLLLSASAEECCNWPALPGDTQKQTDHPFSVGVSYGYTQTDELQSGTRSISQKEARKRYDSRPTEMTSQRVEARAAYTISPEYGVALTIPWVRHTMEMQSFMSDHSMCGPSGYYISQTQGDGMKHKMDPVEGLGDILLEGSVRLLEEGTLENGLHQLYLRPGLKTPTGDYKVRDNGYHAIETPFGTHTMQHGGGYVDPCMQPGTGSWDPIAQLDYHFAKDTFGLSLMSGYQLTTRNPEGYEYGDVASFGLFPSYQPTRMLRFTTGLRYRHIEPSDDHEGNYTDKKDMTKDPASTEGDLTDAILSLDFMPIGRLTLNIGVSLPVWSDLNGIQQAPSELYSAGASVRF